MVRELAAVEARYDEECYTLRAAHERYAAVHAALCGSDAGRAADSPAPDAMPTPMPARRPPAKAVRDALTAASVAAAQTRVTHHEFAEIRVRYARVAARFLRARQLLAPVIADLVKLGRRRRVKARYLAEFVPRLGNVAHEFAPDPMLFVPRHGAHSAAEPMQKTNCFS